MDCPQCARPVPDESSFCLHCGRRLGTEERRAPRNGGGPPAAEPAIAAATPAGPADPGAPAGPGGKRAYAVSIRALADERLRYRVARWVCGVAPAHQIAEIQADLTLGGFSTFLALTPEEAEETRQRIEALGVHPSLLRLAPATEAELLAPASPRAARDPAKSATSFKQTLIVIGVMAAVCLVVGVVWLRLYGQ
jgi:hypothetical protein